MSAVKICPQCGTEYPPDVRFCPNDGSTLRAQKGDGDLVGQVVADRYLIQRKIGEGGMGQVYLAEHVRMKRRSAVKVMSPRLAQDPEAIQRFNREASNACQIAHANVAAVYDFGETDEGLIYLAMEFIDGEPLTQVIRREGALAPKRAASITQQTADGLAAAHELGIVHRDLKPDNIMIARRRDGADIVKVVDFGIAKAIQNDEQKVTKTGLAVGTPEYMSPEQLAGDRLDPRTDIYSLGLVAFAMFTGSLPFPAVTSKEAMIMRLTERPRTLSQIRPDVQWPPELQRVFDRALANDARERYQDVAEFGREAVRAAALMTDARPGEVGTLEIPRVDTPRMATPIATGALPSPATTAMGGTAAPVAEPSSGAAPTAPRPVPTRPSAATVMIQTPDPMVTGRAPGDRAPADRTPTDADGVSRAQLAPTGMMPVVRAVPTPAPSEPLSSSGGRGRTGLYAGVGALAVVAAGLFIVLRPKSANPPALDTPPAAVATTPASPSPAPGPATASAPTTAAAPGTSGSSGGTAPATTVPAAASAPVPRAPVIRWADSLAPMQAEVKAARARFDDGDYAAAVSGLETARSHVDAVVARHPEARAGARTITSRITESLAEVRGACKAEQEMAQRRGRTVPACP